MKKKSVIIITVILLMLYGCSSLKYTKNMFSKDGRKVNRANAIYEEGHKVESIKLYCEALILNEENEQALFLLQKRLPIVDSQIKNNIKIDIPEKEISSLKWIDIAKKYTDLKKINSSYQNISNRIKIKINFTETNYKELLDEIANAYYNAAETLADNNSIETKKKKTKLYNKVLSIKENYKDAKEKFDKYRNEAIQKIYIHEIYEKNTFNVELGTIIYNNLYNKLKQNKDAMMFTKILSKEKIDDADYIIKVDISSIDYLPEKYSLEKNIKVRKKKITLDGEEKKIKVKYIEYIHKKETSCKVHANFKIIENNTQKLLMNNEHKGEKIDKVTWSTYIEDKPNYLNDESEKYAMSKVEIIRRASKDISNKMLDELVNFLK